MVMAGMIPGSVTCNACRSLPAPSTTAASYSSRLTPAMAAI